MTHVHSNYSEMQTLAAVEGLQDATQQQQQSQQQHQMTAIQTPQTRINNPLLRVIPSKLLSSSTIPFATQHTGQSVSLIPTTKVAIIGSQHQQLAASQNSSTAPYIVTLTNNSTNPSGNAINNSGNPHFQQLKNNTQLDGYHYVDETSGHIIYQSNDSLQQNSVYIPQPLFYTNTNGSVITQEGFLHQEATHQQLTAAGKTYQILHQDRLHEAEAQFLSGGPRASPATLRWLLDNIEEAEAVSLPRSTLYGHYIRHCNQLKLEPMNQASFGKLIRSVFTQIRTRRLGTRGNSKYHYYGIQIKSTSKLNNCDYKISESDNYDDSLKRGIKGMTHLSGISNSGNPSLIATGNSNNNNSSSNSSNHQPDRVIIEGAQTTRSVSSLNSPQDYFKNAPVAVPTFGRIELEPNEGLPEGVSQKHLAAYEELYTEHCEAIVTSVVGLQFSVIESFWKSFWRTDNQSYQELEATLPQRTLYALSEMTSVQKYTTKSDYVFYQLLVEILIPDVLKPIPSSLTQVIRNFAKNLEGSLRRSMTGVCEKMVECKVSAAKAFAQILRRYTSLNHLAQAARAVLQNPAQVTQMLSDLNRVDFNNIQEQGHWVCSCNAELVKELESELKRTLEKQSSLEEWASWLEGVVNHILKPVERHSNFIRIALKFLLNWSFYCLMVIRDLTLRSAASFGSFHLIHLLFDEYMFYLIERKVAEVRGETPIAVVSCKKDVDEHFDELISRSQLELFVSKSNLDNRGSEENVVCQEVAASVKQEVVMNMPTNANEEKKEVESYDIFLNQEMSTAGLMPSTLSEDSKRNLKITNVLNTSSGKMVVFVPSIESRNSIKRFKPNFKS